MAKQNRTTHVKREREQKKRERQQRKAEKTAEKRELRLGGQEDTGNATDQQIVAGDSTTDEK